MRMTRLLLSTTIVIGALAVATPVAAGGSAAAVEGSATCDEATGLTTIEWVVTNLTSGGGAQALSFVSVTQSPEGTPIVFAPDPIPVDGTSSGQAVLPGSTTGLVTLDITLFGDVDGQEFEVAGTVELSECLAVVEPVEVIEAIEASPDFTG
jgi:hypothetical protein